MKPTFFSKIAGLFSSKAAPELRQRTYAELTSVGGQNDDWAITNFSEDAEIWQNTWALRGRMRDLFRCNPFYIAYRETLWSNVFGADGTMLRMRIKETEDRVINTPDEEKAIRAYEQRRNRVAEYLESKTGQEFKRCVVLRCLGNNGTRTATVQAGESDIYANLLIERKWKEWQRREFCDLRGVCNYQTIRQIRLISGVRDGDFFIRMVKDPSKKVNKFGFALRMVNAEWCDHFLNVTLTNGNVIRMGIEYEMGSWGIGKVVAFHFIKRQPRDWMSGVYGSVGGSGAFSYGGAWTHDRIPADEIIHYARAVDAEGTRPAPWAATTIPSSRQRDQAMLAETIAWRAAACKTGWLESDIVPEGGYAEGEAPVDPRDIGKIRTEAGGIYGLPKGVRYKDSDPRHPNSQVEEFRKASMRDGCAGAPGANYSTMANDYEAINFSAGRLQRLDTNETNMVLQAFDNDYAECPIFENWLYMLLMTGEVNLPLAKFDKFNNKVFSGRRWQGVDPVKDATASALMIANKLSSRTREAASYGRDFEEVLFELAEEEMQIEQFGMDSITTVEGVKPAEPAEDVADDEEASETTPAKKPKAKKGLTHARK